MDSRNPFSTLQMVPSSSIKRILGFVSISSGTRFSSIEPARICMPAFGRINQFREHKYLYFTVTRAGTLYAKTPFLPFFPAISVYVGT